MSTRHEGFGCLAAFILTIPLANWMIGNFGSVCIPNGPCLISVGFGLDAPSGVLMIGLALVLRDLVQRRLGKNWTIGAIAVGTIASAFVAPPTLVMASTVAFLFSELADFAVYTPLQKKRLITAVLASSFVGLMVDSVLFLYLAFGSLDFMWGQVVGKSWMVLIAIPVIWWIRERDKRMNFEPA